MSWLAEIHPLDNNVIRIREQGGETIICEIPIPCEAEREMKWRWAVKMAAAPRMLEACQSAVDSASVNEDQIYTMHDKGRVAYEKLKSAIAAATETTIKACCGESKGKSI